MTLYSGTSSTPRSFQQAAILSFQGTRRSIAVSQKTHERTLSTPYTGHFLYDPLKHQEVIYA